jgi:PAS domain S-box-containing protein
MDNRDLSFFEAHPLFILDHQTLDILDVNDVAVEVYGYKRQELLSMNVNDLGEKQERSELIEDSLNKPSDRIWTHTTKSGEKLYVQFTHHTFYHQGSPAKFAIAHNVSQQVEQKENSRVEFPKFVTHESNFPMAKIEWDGDFQVRSWSEKAEELFGWREDEVVGRSGFFDMLIAKDELTEAREKIAEAVKNNDSHFSVESSANTKDGKQLICEWHNSLIYDKDNELHSIYSLVTDISSRKQSENLFRALSEESLVGVYLIQDGIFKYVNPRFAEIFGYEREEITNSLSPYDLAHPDARETVQKNIEARIGGNVDSMEYDFLCTTKAGATIHVNVFGSAITYMGKPAIIGTLLDITDEEETIRKYQASVESFQDLFDSISDAIYIQDREGRFLEVNQGAVEMYGYEQSFFIGQTPEVLAAPGKVDLVQTQKYTQQALNGSPQSFEWWGKRKNGEVFPQEIICNPGTYFGEDVVITIARDITDRYEAEEKLRKNEEMFRQLFQNSPIPITLMDKRQEIRQINDAFEKTFGYTKDEIEGLNIDQLVVPDDEQDVAEELSNTIFNGETIFHQGKRLRKDGSLIDVLIYGVPVIVKDKTVAIFGIYVDITDRMRAEEQVKKSLKEKEVLLAEIHHRVKNNLAVITGLLELQSYNTTSGEASDVLKASQMRVNSIALIHEKLYQTENLSEISFDQYLEELTDIIVSSLQSSKTDITISIDADPVSLTVNQAIPCGLILNEVITNAYKHAFPDRDSGEITIIFSEQDSKITMSIADNGIGSSDEVSLEDPNSLGIKLIRTLAKQLGGDAAFSDANPGTKFSLQFKLEE